MILHDPVAAGEAAKHQGIARAVSAADLQWKITAYECIVECARKLAQFTADDVFAKLDKTGEQTHENRAFGGIIRRAAAAGICQKTHTFPETRPSVRPELHRGREQIWDSLIVGSAAPYDNPFVETSGC